MSAYRHVQNSAVFVGQDYSATGAKFELRRTWRSGCDFIFASGYEHSDYNAVTGSSRRERQDDSFFVRPAVQVKLASWAQAELFCGYRRNYSTLSRFSFRDSQIGVQVTFPF
jgi:hypothetical protein